MQKLTHEYLLKRLNYNSADGNLTWRKRYPVEFSSGNTSSEANCSSWNKKYAGKIAGYTDLDGYVYISIDKNKYLAHRLAWFHYHGYLPENDIDHKKRIRTDNRVNEIREVSRQCNLRNAKLSSNNTSKIKGVSFCKRDKKWRSFIMVDYKHISLGYHKIFNDAVAARWEAEVKYKFPNCNTSSSSYNYLKDNCLL